MKFTNLSIEVAGCGNRSSTIKLKKSIIEVLEQHRVTEVSSWRESKGIYRFRILCRNRKAAWTAVKQFEKCIADFCGEANDFNPAKHCLFGLMGTGMKQKTYLAENN